MPYSNNPHYIILYSIEKPIRLRDYFTKWQVWELRENPARFWKFY